MEANKSIIKFRQTMNLALADLSREAASPDVYQIIDAIADITDEVELSKIYDAVDAQIDRVEHRRTLRAVLAALGDSSIVGYGRECVTHVVMEAASNLGIRHLMNEDKP